ncbi:hypothetical protein G9F72_021225 [Clostridium estertheticum]|uniref:hypothetical protein n=1 Tax=Clostridium estertheticum TaxID=238834 RepID=UPI0013E97CF4|nr:hypothetical protein [Clostridium estertheticum]MBZ9688847.1 hypothetical protein [Clostridium estertheticum]
MRDNFTSKNKDSCNLIKHEINLKNSVMDILTNTKKEIEDKIDSYNVDIDKTFIIDVDPIIDKILEIFDGKINSPFKKLI